MQKVIIISCEFGSGGRVIGIARKITIARDDQPGDMKKHILSIDKKRKKYYEYYPDKRWSNQASYHLCFNTVPHSVDDCADIMDTYVARYSQEEE